MLDYIHYQSEEAGTEVRIELEFIFDDGEGALAEPLIDNGKLIAQLFSHIFYHC